MVSFGLSGLGGNAVQRTQATLCCVLAALSASVSGANAAEIEWREGYREIDAFGAGIYLTGEIEAGDLEQLKKVWDEAGDNAQSGISLLVPGTEDNRRALSDEIEPITLFLNSSGGDAVEAFKIGQFVHQAFLKTEAPTTRQLPGPLSTYLGGNPDSGLFDGGAEMICASSCAFIWLAGRWRAGDRVAFHRPYEEAGNASRSGDELDRSAAMLKDLTMAYLNGLGVDERIFPVIMSQSREEAIWLANLREVADVPVFSLAFEEQAIEACALSASGHQMQNEAFLRLLMNSEYTELRQQTDANQCVEWELIKLQAQAWWANLDAKVEAEKWEKSKTILLGSGAAALAIACVVFFYFRRRRRRAIA